MTALHTDNRPVSLSDTTLSDLPDSVARPTYDRASLTPGIVHVGVGNFHRAHQAWYMHRLMQNGAAQDWAIIGAGVRPYDAAMRERLLAQDCLTTLVKLDPAGTGVEIIGSMIDYLPITDGHGALVTQMADASTRIVSMTVTEGGYFRDAGGAFDTHHPDIMHDVAHPDAPRTVFGAIVAALRIRRETGRGPFTALSCDNLQGNGGILRDCVVSLARMTDAGLADWIDETVTFPNSMVDCIVPATTPEVLAQVQDLGIADAAPVTHESFRQWVIEDAFCAGRPAWETVGATLTDDVHSYEAMKLRILNGGHQILANVGEILGVPTIADCMADPEISAFLAKVQRDEVLAHVDSVPQITPEAYLTLIEGRFANPMIHDTTRRVAFDGSSRHVGFLLPTLRDALAADAPISGLALTEALWARMCAGTREDGSVIDPNDPDWDALTTAAKAAKTRPAAWRELTQIYDTLGENPRFAEAFDAWLTRIWSDGARATVAFYLDGGSAV